MNNTLNTIPESINSEIRVLNEGISKVNGGLNTIYTLSIMAGSSHSNECMQFALTLGGGAIAADGLQKLMKGVIKKDVKGTVIGTMQTATGLTSLLYLSSLESRVIGAMHKSLLLAVSGKDLLFSAAKDIHNSHTVNGAVKGLFGVCLISSSVQNIFTEIYSPLTVLIAYSQPRQDSHFNDDQNMAQISERLQETMERAKLNEQKVILGLSAISAVDNLLERDYFNISMQIGLSMATFAFAPGPNVILLPLALEGFNYVQKVTDEIANNSIDATDLYGNPEDTDIIHSHLKPILTIGLFVGVSLFVSEYYFVQGIGVLSAIGIGSLGWKALKLAGLSDTVKNVFNALS